MKYILKYSNVTYLLWNRYLESIRSMGFTRTSVLFCMTYENNVYN